MRGWKRIEVCTYFFEKTCFANTFCTNDQNSELSNRFGLPLWEKDATEDPAGSIVDVRRLVQVPQYGLQVASLIFRKDDGIHGCWQ